MLIPDHPKMIRFGEKECRALRLALENHFEKISDFLETTIPKERLALYRDIIVEPKKYGGAISLGFIPNEEHKIFYGLAAQLEFQKLAKTALLPPNYKLSRDCEITERVKALQNVMILTATDKQKIN